MSNGIRGRASRALLRRATALAAGLTLLAPAGASQVDAAPPTTDEALERLKDSLQKEPGLSAETKAAMASFFEALAARGSRLDELDLGALQRLAASAGPGGAVASPGRWEQVREQLTLAGDFRLRLEASGDLDDQEDRDRERIRLRFGGDYRLDDEFSVGARLRTGDPDDPNSPHSTLGDVFNSDNFELDRAFLAWKPQSAQGLRLVGGKFGHPFQANPVYGELVWDADVNPEGLAATYTVPGDEPGEKLDLALGHYVSVEQGGGDEAAMFVAQVAGARRLGEKTTGTLALGYYDYGNLTPDGSLALVNENPSQTAGGNQLVDTDGDTVMDDFASGFQIWNPIAAVTYEGWGRPVTFSTEFIHNADATGTEDSGMAAGVSVGRQKQAGDWLWYGQWQKVEQDAVFAAFAQDDFLLASNFEGWVLGTRYRITDSVGAHLWGLICSREKRGSTATTDGNGDQWRLRLDLDVRF
jgi:hypothetical protein